MHRGGRGRLSSLFLQRSTSGGALGHREGVRPTAGGMDPQKHSTGCLQGASKFSDGNWFPLGFRLGDGRGRWRLPAPLFPHRALSFQGSITLPPASSRPPCSPGVELLSFNIPDVKSLWLSELTESGPSAFASQTSGALPCRAGCPSTALAPSHQAV